MARKKISELTATTTPSLDAVVPIVQSTTVTNKYKPAFPLNIVAFGASTSGTAAANTTAIQAAVAAALAAGRELYWPAGTYTTNASIASFHSVRHYGPGKIGRGSDTFAVEPRDADTNTLYVATTGSDANDGLSSSQPKLTFQSAFDALKNYGPELAGNWTITAAAGTYSLKEQQHDTPSKNNVVIQGPAVGHPNVPTCILDGTGFAASEHGMRITGPGTRGFVKNIKFQDYAAGSDNSIGLVGEQGAVLITENVHADNCDWTGIYAFECAWFRIKGGILNACRSGFIANACSGTVGYQATQLSEGTQVTNCTQSGIYWSRGAQGHIDYCTLDGNVIGIHIDTCSRVHVVDCDIKNNTVGVQAETNSTWIDDTSEPAQFSGNTTDKVFFGNAVEYADRANLAYHDSSASRWWWGRTDYGTNVNSNAVYVWGTDRDTTAYWCFMAPTAISVAALVFGRGDSNVAGRIQYQHGDATKNFRFVVEGTAIASLYPTLFQPQTDDSVNLGTSSLRFGALHCTRIDSEALAAASSTSEDVAAGANSANLDIALSASTSYRFRVHAEAEDASGDRCLVVGTVWAYRSSTASPSVSTDLTIEHAEGSWLWVQPSASGNNLRINVRNDMGADCHMTIRVWEVSRVATVEDS